MSGEMMPSQPHSNELATNANGVAVYEQPEIIDGELEGAGNEVSPYVPKEEDIIDAELVEDEPLAITGSPPAESQPTRIDVAFVDQSYDAKQAARDEADRRLTEELNQGGGFKRLVNGIWKGNMAKDYYRLKYARQAEADISQVNNVLAFEADEDRSNQSRQATVDRFTSQYEETIHTEAGERRETLDSELELTQEIKQLIRDSIEQNLSEDAIIERRTRILMAYRDAHGNDLLGAGIATADNLLAVRAATLGAIENGETLDDLIDNMRVMVGESRSGVRTESHYNMVDRAIEKLNRTKIGSLVGPEVVATATTLAASLLRFGSQKVISAAAMTIAPGVGAGVWAGLRENKRVKDERAQHSREMAQGKVFTAGEKRREQMEWTRYETSAAADLIQTLDDRFNDQVDFTDADQFQAALDALGATQLRIQLSDSRNIDLISYSATESIEEERLALDIAMAQAKTMAELHLDANRVALGVGPDASLQTILNQRTEAYIENVEGDISEKDRAFKRLKARRVAVATASGVISGLTIGLAAQEGIAMLSDTRQGLVEQLWNAHNAPYEGMQHQTLLNGLFHGNNGQDVITHHGAENTFHTSILGEHKGTFNVSGDQTLVENGDHSLNLVDPTGHATVEHLAVNTDGSLPQASLDTLHQHGMSVLDKSAPVDVLTHETKTVSVDQYAHSHGTKVTRDLWYDNNTPAPKFDKNELGLQWGGHDGIGANGSYAFNVSAMTENGSFSGNQSADWVQQAHEGTLKMTISGSENSQGNALMVDIKPDGSIDIPAGSPAAHFFSNENGHAVFNGAYAEVVQTTGVSGGSEHIRSLATLVGNGNVHSVTDVVDVHTSQIHPEYTIVSNGYDTSEHFSSFTEMAPVIPVIPRRSMEEAFVKNERARRYDGGNEYLSYRETEERAKETSPRLRDNPDATLNMAQETDFYKQALVKNRGKEYVADIDRIVANSKELNGIDSKLKTIVTIPVNAAGRSESDNIYNVLTKAYGSQDAETLKGTMILLHVNWFDSYDDNADVMRDNIARTKAEIERAKADCPQLTVATIETEWKRAEVQDGVIGHVARKLNDAALLALNAATSSGRIGPDQDVLLLRNDADPKGIAANYLKRFSDKFAVNPEVDIFTGLTSFDNTKAARVPGLVFAANFMQSLDLLAAKREGASHTGGANFGVRASVFAAVGAIGFDATDNIAGSDDVRIGQRIKAARSGRFSRNRKARSFYAHRNSFYSPAAAGGSAKRRVGMSVDARIDTDSDRGERLYEQGIPIALQWTSFSENGYRPRDAGLDGQQKESVQNDTATVIERIRNDMEGSINIMGQSSAVVETALTFAFLGVGKKGYELTSRGGAYRFRITPAGADYLKNHLTRDVRGRFDAYGSRKLRQLYGQASPTAKRQPNHSSLIRV